MTSFALLRYSAYLVLALILIAVIPAIAIPLGLPPEGDAIDYRIPLIRWILRHHTFPNWSWTPIDDYPALGEILILPLYWLNPGFGRIVPILAYFACGWAGGLILRDAFVWPQNWADSKAARFLIPLVGAAWILPFRPLAIQANLFMLDNLATAFALFSLWSVIRANAWAAGIYWGLALATKYMIWAASPAILVAWMLAQGWNPRARRGAYILIAMATLGALPTLIRNTLLNQNPVFPMFLGLFGQMDAGLNYNLELYGRGRDLLSFLLLPWDFLVTHSFQRDLFDYTLGKLFYVQIGITFAAVLWCRWLKLPRSEDTFPQSSAQGTANRHLLALWTFVALHTIGWFLTSQQMRFLVASWIIVELSILRLLWRHASPKLVSIVLLIGLLSVASVQKDMWLMLFGKSMIFQADVDRAKNCLGDLVNQKHVRIAHASRDSVLGFFDYDFMYVKPHVYRVNPSGKEIPEPDYIYSTQRVTYPGYEGSQGEDSCLWIRRNPSSTQ